MNSRWLRLFVNLWPPYLCTGIHATHLSADYRNAEVELRERWYNRNYVGTHFGGSLFAMTDAWYMIMLLHNLGPEYYVWDKSASIDYITPGRGTLRAHFHLDENALQLIRAQTAHGEKYLPEFTVEILNADKQLVARVVRTLYVRRKKSAR